MTTDSRGCRPWHYMPLTPLHLPPPSPPFPSPRGTALKSRLQQFTLFSFTTSSFSFRSSKISQPTSYSPVSLPLTSQSALHPPASQPARQPHIHQLARQPDNLISSGPDIDKKVRMGGEVGKELEAFTSTDPHPSPHALCHPTQPT